MFYSFVHEYFSWQQSQEAIEKRHERLQNYLTEDLHQLNSDMIRADIPTSFVVSKIQIWNVTNIDEKNFEVLFTVGQQITEGKSKKNIDSTYNIIVYMDDTGNIVITKNPTMSSHPSKSGYQPKSIESDGTVDVVAAEEINEFLETFFKLYPSITV